MTGRLALILALIGLCGGCSSDGTKPPPEPTPIDVSGWWVGDMQLQDSTYRLKLELTQVGDRVTGAITFDHNTPWPIFRSFTRADSIGLELKGGLDNGRYFLFVPRADTLRGAVWFCPEICRGWEPRGTWSAVRL